MVSVGFALLLLLVQGLDVLMAYNVGGAPERIFSANGSRYFGYRVRQIRSTDGERILVGDPDLGTLHACDVIRGTCDLISLPNQNQSGHIGLTLEVEPKSQRCIVCGLDVPRECDHMLYMNGLCYMMDSSLIPSPKLLPGYQECRKAEVDLCFLFDGSGSTGAPELRSIQHFLRDAIKNLRNTTVNFAIVQFSGRSRTELDFLQYQKSENLMEVIDKLTILGGLTKTFNGIKYTLDNVFTEKAGHRPQAKKVLLILTDGEAHDDKGNIIQEADQRGVRRYLIGVGNNFNTSEATRKLMRDLASEPTDRHTRVLNNFGELENLFAELQRNIMAIEGVQTCAAASGGVCNGSAQEVSFSRELSSAGLSAALTQDGQFLGDPGIFDWSGGVLSISGPEKLMNISLQDDDKNGYLGYSVAVLRDPEGILYVSGAPRYQYVGRVTIFRETPDEAKRIQILGEQVGSYFGSEIEVCDMDQDGLSDVVLIAAPHFYDLRWSGQVSVYRYIEGRLYLQLALHGESGHLHSQFGAAISSLGDLNGDGWSDVAVGAPYEGEGRGAVYIYRGGAGEVQSMYSQRLTAPDGSHGFGLSIDGVLDMTRDGLMDVVVGAAGSVALYRSRPLLNVNVTVMSTPPEIPIPTMESASCRIEVILKICADPEILTANYTGPLNVSFQYVVTLEPGRPVSRMSFIGGQREVTEALVLLVDRPVCWNHSIALLDCFLEDSSPVLVSLTASQVPNVSLWLISPSSRLTDTIQIPFQLCGSGGSCEPDFHLHLTTDTLVVEDRASFSVTLKLQNTGENARRVKLQTTYPTGLSFRKANITEASRRVSLSCEDSKTRGLVCNVSHPIMRRASWAKIYIMFEIEPQVSWPDRVLLTVNVTSENDGNTTGMKNTVTRDIPVLYPINIITRRMESSTKYLQFIEQKEQSSVTHAYQILGGGLVHTEFQVTVTVPAVDLGDLVWNHTVTCWGGNCTQLNSSQDRGPGNKTFLCTMEQRGTVNVEVTGALRPTHAWTVEKSVNLITEVNVTYNGTRYIQLGKKYHHVQVMTHVDLVVLPNHVPYIAGGTGGGVILLLLICVLLYKCGFFKRYKDRMEEDSPVTDALQPMTSDEDETEGATAGPREPLTSLSEPTDSTGDL